MVPVVIFLFSRSLSFLYIRISNGSEKIFSNIGFLRLGAWILGLWRLITLPKEKNYVINNVIMSHCVSSVENRGFRYNCRNVKNRDLFAVRRR